MERGSFKIVSGRIGASDPCYCESNPEVEFKAKNGNWNFKVDMEPTEGWGVRVKSLEISHADIAGSEILLSKDFNVGVDSGQFGFFDFSILDEEKHNDFYDTCCNSTIGRKNYGVIYDQGVCSSSGFGDGGYALIVWFNKDQEAVKARVVFIEEES